MGEYMGVRGVPVTLQELAAEDEARRMARFVTKSRREERVKPVRRQFKTGKRR